MASGPIITSQQIEAEMVEAVTDFLFLGSKITVDGDCSHEIKRQQRHYSANKSPYSQVCGLPSGHGWL